MADAKKLLSTSTTKGFSPVYIAGTDWYVAMGFVFDYGGGIATQVSGTWKGLLASPKSIAGLTAYKKFFLDTSRASKTTDETHPWGYDVYSQGLTASVIGQSWFTCCVKPYTASTGQFVMPGHIAGKPMPGFLGGSDLAVPVKGNIPNATNRLANSVNERAASRSWFIPSAKHWADVENGNILRNMLAQILTGKLSVQQAAQSASDNIASVLNQP
jgi:N,N'-diacetylchitobiose transport system substrate-binding protein